MTMLSTNSACQTAIAIAVFSAVFVQAHSAQAIGTTQIVAIENDIVPGVEGTLFSLSLPQIDNRGMATFGTGVRLPNGIFLTDNAILQGDGSLELRQVARAGEAIPGIDGIFGSVQGASFRVNARGDVGFYSDIPGTREGGYHRLFVAEPAGTTRIVFRVGQPTPSDGSTYAYLGHFRINDSGEVAADARTTNPTLHGIYRSNGVSGPSVVVRERDAAPGGNGLFASALSNFSLNDSGQVAFAAALLSTAGAASDNFGLFIADDSGAITTIARRGQDSPISGTIFSDFASLSLNNAGQVAFWATTEATTDGPPIPRILLADGQSSAIEIASVGMSIPDREGNLSTNLSEPLINDNGVVAFTANVSASRGTRRGDSALFVGDGVLPLREIVSEGDPLSGGNAFVGEISASVQPTFLNLNDRDELALLNRIVDSNGASIGDAILFYSESLGLTEVIREGDMLLGQTILQLELEGFDRRYPTNQYRSALNDLGQIAFRFRLANNRSGIAIWTPPVAVPEPTTIALFGFGIIGIGAWLSVNKI